MKDQLCYHHYPFSEVPRLLFYMLYHIISCEAPSQVTGPGDVLLVPYYS